MRAFTRVAMPTLLLLWGMSVDAKGQAVVPAGLDSLRPPVYTDWSADSIEGTVVDLAFAQLVQAMSTGGDGLSLLLDPTTGTVVGPMTAAHIPSGGGRPGNRCTDATPQSVAAQAKGRSGRLRWTIAPGTRHHLHGNGEVTFQATFVVRGDDRQSSAAQVQVRFDPVTMRMRGETGLSQLLCESMTRTGGKP